jgi:hypothetical protein
VFFLFYFKEFKVPFMPVKIPRVVMEPFLTVSNKVLIEPLLAQDGVALEAEQEGWEAHYDEPIAELSPAVHAFQALTVKKWEAHLARQGDKDRGEKKEGLVDAASLGRKRSGTSIDAGSS